jgi:TldD protein
MIPSNESEFKKILGTALSRGASFAEIYYEHSVSNSLVFNERKVKSINRGVVEGVGIRVFHGEQTGYAFSDDLGFEKLQEAASVASFIAAGRDGSSVADLQRRKATPLEVIEIQASDVDVARKVDLLQRADDAARSFDRRVHDVSCNYADLRKQIMVINSEGVWVENDEQLLRMMISVTAIEDGLRDAGMEFLGGRYGFEYFDAHTPEDAAQKAVLQSLTKLHARPAPIGQYPVVVEAGWGGVLVHEGVGHGLEGDFNRKGTSVYAGRLGQKVCSPLVTIIDDGTVPHARGSLPIDDEGTPMQRTVLIENGVLVGFLYDKLNARLMNVDSTGNGRRESFRHVPLPRMRNTFIDGGSEESRQIIRSVKKGVYAKSLGGGQVDIVSGNFVFEINEGYMIENGELGHPIRGANLIGNGPDAMSKVVGVGTNLAIETRTGSCGKDGQYVPVGVGQPTILLSEMTIGGTER